MEMKNFVVKKWGLEPDPYFYKIASYSNGTVLELQEADARNGTSIITNHSDSVRMHQLWKPFRKTLVLPSFAVDGWALSSNCWQSATTGNIIFRVLDQDVQRETVQQRDYAESLTQLWYYQQVIDTLFVIRNASNNKALECHGPGNQVTVTAVENGQLMPQHLWEIRRAV